MTVPAARVRRVARSTALSAAIVAALLGCTASPDADGSASPVGTPSAGPASTDGAAGGGSGTAAPDATATSTPGPTATPTATPAPTGSPADATSLLIGPTSFSLVDASGEAVGTFPYRDGTGAVDALAAAFGAAPQTEEIVPEYEGYASTASTWGGFRYRDLAIYDAGDPEPEYPEPDFAIDATAASVGDVAVSTLSGVEVGDALADVIAANPGTQISDGAGGFLDRLLLGETPVGDSGGTTLTYGVIVAGENGSADVTSIGAPGWNWGV